MGTRMLADAARSKDGYLAWSLVKAGAEVAVTSDTNGNTPLIVAASHGSLVVVDSYLAGGGDAFVTNKVGVNALMAACRRCVPCASAVSWWQPQLCGAVLVWSALLR